MLHRIAERIIDWISGDRELDVEPENHPYYPGEALDPEPIHMRSPGEES